jgi:hypothetical protein
MSTPAQWRDASRQASDAAEREASPHLKQLWANHSLALAQLADEIERRETNVQLRVPNRSRDGKSLIGLWRDRAKEARTQAEQFQDGSISQTILLTVSDAYGRLASREERYIPHEPAA